MFGLKVVELSVRLGQQETKTAYQFIVQHTVRVELFNAPAVRRRRLKAAEGGLRILLSRQAQKQKPLFTSHRFAQRYDFRACRMERK